MIINSWEMMFALAFFAGIGYIHISLFRLISFSSFIEITRDINNEMNQINGIAYLIVIEFNGYYNRVRVANELGAGNGEAAKLATKVCVVQSSGIGLFFFAVVLIFRGNLALIFSTSDQVIEAVDGLSFLLACSILLNSVQPVLSGNLIDRSTFSESVF